MFLTQAVTEETRRNMANCPEAQQEAKQPRHTRRLTTLLQRVADDAVLHLDLNRLHDTHGPHATELHPVEKSLVDRAAIEKWLCQRIGCSDGVLDRQVDADATDRRHRMRRVADQQQAGKMPALQTVDLHEQRADFVPRGNCGLAVGQKRSELRHRIAQHLDRLRTQRLVAPLGTR
jgi:hypothetical protein